MTVLRIYFTGRGQTRAARLIAQVDRVARARRERAAEGRKRG